MTRDYSHSQYSLWSAEPAECGGCCLSNSDPINSALLGLHQRKTRGGRPLRVIGHSSGESWWKFQAKNNLHFLCLVTWPSPGERLAYQFSLGPSVGCFLDGQLSSNRQTTGGFVISLATVPSLHSRVVRKPVRGNWNISALSLPSVYDKLRCMDNVGEVWGDERRGSWFGLENITRIIIIIIILNLQSRPVVTLPPPASRRQDWPVLGVSINLRDQHIFFSYVMVNPSPAGWCWPGSQNNPLQHCLIRWDTGTHLSTDNPGLNPISIFKYWSPYRRYYDIRCYLYTTYTTTVLDSLFKNKKVLV